MSQKKEKARRASPTERAFALFGIVIGLPTNPHAVPFSIGAPKELALVHRAESTAEADLVRQVLMNAEFHVEYVPTVSTGAFGTTGSLYVYVHTGEEKEAREFLRQLRQEATEEESQENKM